jgi:nickel-type superoxide dismutase maturation protease
VTRYSSRDAKCLDGPSGLRPSAAVPAFALLGMAIAFSRVAACFERVTVVGDSMSPELVPGDRLLVRRLRPHICPARTRTRRRSVAVKPGDIVVAKDPRDPSRVLVKRVARLQGREVWLAGDNPGKSTDSRDFGPVLLSDVAGRAVYRYSPPARAGRLGLDG